MKSKYRGAYETKNGKLWRSQIMHDGKIIYLGTFSNEIDAAKAYDEKAFELKGDKARLNFKSNKHYCEAPECKNTAKSKFNNLWLCNKHKLQLKQHGKFLNRTIYDPNEIIIENEYAYIILYDKQGNEKAKTKIDKKNINIVQEYKWYLRPDGYVATNNYNGEYAYLHCIIYNKLEKKYVDHIDRNKLNNTEENLREADGSENQMNKGIRCDNSSGKVGVHWSEQNNAWCSMICINGNHINLGYFLEYEDAVNCRTNAEKQYFKDFKTINEKEIGKF